MPHDTTSRKYRFSGATMPHMNDQRGPETGLELALEKIRKLNADLRDYHEKWANAADDAVARLRQTGAELRGEGDEGGGPAG